VNPELKTVIELQQIDLKIAELTSQIDDLPTQIQALEAQLSQFIQAHEERKQRLSANQKERRELEADIQPIQAKISKHKDQLYEVKTNEQYRAMLKEIEGEEANIRQIEDQILERMVEAEELQKKVQEAAAHLEGEKSRAAAEKARLESARQAALEERDRAATRRKELEAALSDAVRDLYERVRKARHGVAVAEARDGFCMACNVRLRPQAYNEVRRNDAIISCENCVRILYYIEPKVSAENPPQDKDARAAV
jgi:uncharacterized protein